VAQGLDAMVRHGLRLDALIRPRHLRHLPELRDRYPGLALVIDHAAKPDIAGGDLSDWARDMRRAAADGISCCKLSGLVTEAGPGWTLERLRPVADLLLEAFGPERLMWGSDWPVLLLAAGYQGWTEATDRLLDGLTPGARDAILGGTARRFYGLEIR
jgi:L-fuconolactonase